MILKDPTTDIEYETIGDPILVDVGAGYPNLSYLVKLATDPGTEATHRLRLVAFAIAEELPSEEP